MTNNKGYVGLIVLLITLTIIVILLTMKNSPLNLLGGSEADNTGSPINKAKQLQTDVEGLRSEQQKALEVIDQDINK